MGAERRRCEATFLEDSPCGAERRRCEATTLGLCHLRLTTTSGGRAERGRSELTHTGALSPTLVLYHPHWCFITHTGVCHPYLRGKTVWMFSALEPRPFGTRLSALRTHRGLGSLVVASSRSSLSLLTRSLQPVHLARSSLRSSLERT